MQKKIFFILSLTVVVYLAESAPVKLDTLEFDKLDTDLSDLGYEVEEEDLDDYSKFLDGTGDKSKSDSTENEEKTKSKTNVKSSAQEKKNSDKIGVKSKYDIGDLKNIFKTIGAHDLGSYDAAKIFALAEGIAAAVVGTDGNEKRTYKKGTKTRGFHRVHHKDEYKKDQEFYEDDETKGTINKIGAKAIGAKIGGGAGFDKGYFHHDRQKDIHGKQGYLDKGYLDAEINKYSDSKGFDALFSNDN